MLPIAVTMGDPAGIGPEIIVAALKKHPLRRVCDPVIVGSRRVMRTAGWKPALAPLLDPGLDCRRRPGKPDEIGRAHV